MMIIRAKDQSQWVREYLPSGEGPNLLYGPVFRKEILMEVSRALSQYKDRLSKYGDSHIKDKTVARPSYL